MTPKTADSSERDAAASLMSFSHVSRDGRVYCGSGSARHAAIALDPTCGKSLVPAAAAASAIAQGVTYYFCSESCHRQFTWRHGRISLTRHGHGS